MIMSAADSTFFMLNEAATRIWQAADGITPLSEIIAKSICAEFDIDVETATRDAEDFVERLSRHGVLMCSEQPIVRSSEPGAGS